MALTALFLVLLFPVGEAVLRLFDLERLPYTNPDLYQADEELSYVMRPNVDVYSHGTWVRTNRHGLRSVDWDDVHANGNRCVMFLGHSIAFGFGLEPHESFVERFSEFNRRGLAGINLGHCGYRYAQEFGIAHRFAGEIRPVASVVLFTGNDFDDLYDVFEPNARAQQQPGSVPFPGKRWLRRNSVLYAWLRKRYNALLVGAGIREEQGWGHRILQGDTAENLEHFAAYEAELLRLMERTGAPLVLCAFPNGVPTAALERVRAMAERVGAYWLDLSGLWEDEYDYLMHNSLGWDSHPNAATHRTMAKLITDAVLRVIDDANPAPPSDG